MSDRYEDRTKEELTELAQQRGVSGYSNMSKPQLVAALRGAEDPDQVMVAKNSFHTTVDGVPTFVEAGKARVQRGHPWVKDSPENWEEVDTGLTYEVEQATKAPGEKRGEKK